MATAPATDDTDLASHFEFGANWRRFLSLVDESRVEEAEQSLRSFLSLESVDQPLSGRRFLDAGCGSGLFSLAALRLGAEVVSFDLDPDSVACARELHQRFASNSERWTIMEGSALDGEFLSSLGTFDVVYSWGVLHHTGAMWDAIDAVSQRTNDGGQFFVAIYNEQGDLSTIWRGIKKLYVSLPGVLKTPYVIVVGGVYYAAKVVMAIGRTVGRHLVGLFGVTPSSSPPSVSMTRSGDRGMSRWYDLVDWVGGYPFEVASPEALQEFLSERQFQVEKMRTVGGKLGCNELVFRKVTS